MLSWYNGRAVRKFTQGWMGYTWFVRRAGSGEAARLYEES